MRARSELSGAMLRQGVFTQDLREGLAAQKSSMIFKTSLGFRNEGLES